jgi:hypothetical protein
MKEFDTRLEAKKKAEFITPEKLREFLAKKIKGEGLNILEPAIGSGQLLFNLFNQINSIEGFDVNSNALEMAKQNFNEKLIARNQDFITTDVKAQYDVAIANYPFSLKPTEEQKEFIANDSFLKQFYAKNIKNDIFGNATYDAKPDNIKGKLDFVFILKSFNLAKEGFYLAFPGIAYRQEEERFRKYLIENKFIKEFGLLNNCKFDHTSISILFLHLTKTQNEETKCFTLDIETGEMLEGVARFEDNQFKYPQKEIVKNNFCPIELEKEARASLIRELKKSFNFSKKIYELDKSLQDNLPSVEDFKQDIINALNDDTQE